MLLDADEGHAELTSRDRLAAELSSLRRMSGVSGREMARQIGISQSKVSRVESGHTLPTITEINAWAHAVAATPRQHRLLIACAEGAFTEVTTWRMGLRGRAHLQGAVQERESAASRLELYQPSVVPGLLQTPQYAQQIFLRAGLAYPEDRLAQAVAGRMNRQLVLHEESRRFDFLISEAALRWRPGSDATHRAQLDRISALSTLGNTGIGVIPLDSADAPYASHAFKILHPLEGEPYVSVETTHAELTVHAAEDVQLYQARWEDLRRSALYGADARAFLGRLGSGIGTDEGTR
ncbi:MAG: helix-turn-helix transcriptional regulator [Streptosporangiaceae bacterium]